MIEVAIHRRKIELETPSDVMKHAEELSGLFNQGFTFVAQTTMDGYLITTFKRERPEEGKAS